jgi:hypothetical protein
MVILGSLMVTPIYFLNTINDAAALLLVRGADFLAAFDQPQREALALLFLRLHDHDVLVNQVFWGLWLFPFGLLVYRSRFLPRLLGVWLMLNCCAYVALSVTGIMWPRYQARVWNAAFPVMFGELAIMLWLIGIGANERQPTAATA